MWKFGLSTHDDDDDDDDDDDESYSIRHWADVVHGKNIYWSTAKKDFSFVLSEEFREEKKHGKLRFPKKNFFIFFCQNVVFKFNNLKF